MACYRSLHYSKAINFGRVSVQCHRGDWRCRAREWCWLWKFEHTFQKTGIRRYPRYHTYSEFQVCWDNEPIYFPKLLFFSRGRERILMNIWKWHMYDFWLGNLSNRAGNSPGGWRSFWSMNFSLDLILEVTTIINPPFGSCHFFQASFRVPHSVIQSYRWQSSLPVSRWGWSILSNVTHSFFAVWWSFGV